MALSPELETEHHDTRHGWCKCGEWHENLGGFKRHLGSKEKGLLLFTNQALCPDQSDTLSYLPPEEVPNYMKSKYRK